MTVRVEQHITLLTYTTCAKMSSPSQIASICARYRLTPDLFRQSADSGVFQIQPGKSLYFLHARLTTGDYLTNIVNGKSGKAGELWNKCTGKRIGEYSCAARNCTNSKYLHGQQHSAEVTAHVYFTTQLHSDPIENVILIPTCSACNNRGNTEKPENETRYPVPGEKSSPLESYKDVPIIFATISPKTAAVKGAGGKGQGKGNGPH